MDPWIRWTIISILIFVTGFFAGSETALASCSQFKFRVRASESKKVDQLVSHMLDRYNKIQVSIVVENNIVNIILSTIAAVLFAYYLQDETVASIVSTVVVGFAIYVIGDSIPKIIARNFSDGYIKVAAFVLVPLYYLLWPINMFFYLASNLVRKLFRVKESVTMTEEDFSNTIDDYEEKGYLDEDESDIIQNALDFTDTSIKNVYTPLNKIYSLNIDDLTTEKLNKILINSNYSRIPMYSKTRDNIVGILNVKTYFNMYLNNNKLDFRKALQKPVFISKFMKLDDVVTTFKKNKTHIALIKDKDKIIGMITLEDVLEEFVGDMDEQENVVKEAK